MTSSTQGTITGYLPRALIWIGNVFIYHTCKTVRITYKFVINTNIDVEIFKMRINYNSSVLVFTCYSVCEFTLVFSEVLVTPTLVLCVCFVDRCLSFARFLLAIVLSVLQFTDCDYTFGIFKLYLNIKVKYIINCDHDVPPHMIG